MRFEYIVFDGWEKLMLYAFKLKETSKIKKIKSDKTVGFKSQSLNIMGQFAGINFDSINGSSNNYF